MMLLPQEKGALVVEERFLVLSAEKSERPEGTLGTPRPLLKAPELLCFTLIYAVPVSRFSLLLLSLIFFFLISPSLKQPVPLMHTCYSLTATHFFLMEAFSTLHNYLLVCCL